MVQCLACAEESLTHQASLLVSPAPRCNSQSVFEVLGHIVVRHDVVQHSADNHGGRGCQTSKRFVSNCHVCQVHLSTIIFDRVKFVSYLKRPLILGCLRLGLSHMALASSGADNGDVATRGQGRGGRAPQAPAGGRSRHERIIMSSKSHPFCQGLVQGWAKVTIAFSL